MSLFICSNQSYLEMRSIPIPVGEYMRRCRKNLSSFWPDGNTTSSRDNIFHKYENVSLPQYGRQSQKNFTFPSGSGNLQNLQKNSEHLMTFAHLDLSGPVMGRVLRWTGWPFSACWPIPLSPPHCLPQKHKTTCPASATRRNASLAENSVG